MEKEYYIDRVKNSHSVYDKVEELALIARLPITVSGYNLKYGFSNMKRDLNTYYYQKDSKTVFIFFEDTKVRLAYFDGTLAEIYDVDLEHDNTFKFYSYNNGNFTEMSINHLKLSLTNSNAITPEFKSILNNLSVKIKTNPVKKIQYCSFEFTLSNLIENEKKINDPMLYIPESIAIIVDNSIGKYYLSKKNIFSMDYREDSFCLTPSLFRSSFIPHYAVVNVENDVDQKVMNPKKIDDITKFMSPLRHEYVKNLTNRVIFDSNNEVFTKFLLRYYDEIIHALNYFQNEDLTKFYVFEDDLNRLQLK